MRFLTEMYQTGQTPLREALNRLTADGLVECREQRGFYVADISRNELVELTKTRCWVESLALRESMAALTPQWEELLLLAEHRLSRTPRSLNTEHFEDNPEWERLHRIFHRTLIGNCGSQSLIAFCGQLADLLYRYRRLSIQKAFPSRHVTDEHQAIMSAVLSGGPTKPWPCSRHIIGKRLKSFFRISGYSQNCMTAANSHSGGERPVCTENLIRVDAVMESPKLAE
jgi:DNA-binding GntR family transcriptional regulator